MTGAVRDQSQGVLETDGLQPANGLTGAGVTIDVISECFNRLGGAADVVNCELLAGRVNINQEGGPGGPDEGRVMAQIVDDLAPGGTIAFTLALRGHTAFAQSINELADRASLTLAPGRAVPITLDGDNSFYSAADNTSRNGILLGGALRDAASPARGPGSPPTCCMAISPSAWRCRRP
jgi:hypothetical protein